MCGGYYAGGLIGVSVRFPPSGVSIIWPATPVLLAALLLTPVRTWWVYLLAVLPTHLHLTTQFQPGVPMVTMLSQFAGNVLNAALGALAGIRWYLRLPAAVHALGEARVENVRLRKLVGYADSAAGAELPARVLGVSPAA